MSDEWRSFFVGCLFGLLLSVVTMLPLGMFLIESSYRTQAVARGYAEYKMIPPWKQATWQWKPATTPEAPR